MLFLEYFKIPASTPIEILNSGKGEVELVPTHASHHDHVGLHHNVPLLGLLGHAILVLRLLGEGILNGEAPDIDVITYRGDDIELNNVKRLATVSHAHPGRGKGRGKEKKGKKAYHKATVNTNRKTQTNENERNLTNTISKHRSLPQAHSSTSTIKNTQRKWVKQNVLIRETRLNEMTDNHPPDRVSIDQTNKQPKGTGIVCQNGRLKIQVCRHKRPDDSDGN
jgi:hypothetical protein